MSKRGREGEPQSRNNNDHSKTSETSPRLSDEEFKKEDLKFHLNQLEWAKSIEETPIVKRIKEETIEYLDIFYPTWREEDNRKRG